MWALDQLSLDPTVPEPSTMVSGASVMLSLYVSASVVQSPPVTSVMARGTWYCFSFSRPPIEYLIRHRGYGARGGHHCRDCPTADHESLL